MDLVTTSRRERALQLHRFLKSHAFYPLATCTLLACGFVLTRAVLADEVRYAFLVKNLLLAWIPYWCALVLSGWERRNALTRRRVAIVGAAWLVWFPNAPYMVTEFVHLHDRPPLEDTSDWIGLGDRHRSVNILNQEIPAMRHKRLATNGNHVDLEIWPARTGRFKHPQGRSQRQLVKNT